MSRILSLLDRRSTFNLLLVLNVLMVLVTLWLTRNTTLSDSWSYLSLAEGLLHGEYSMWWPLEGYYADTFRAPGYPLFIAFFIKIFGSWQATKVAHFILYWVALHLTFRTIERFDPRRSTRSIFLLLLLPMMNIPFYITQLYTEIPVLAALALVLHLFLAPGRWSLGKAMVIGLCLGFIFLCKPIFLLFPFLLTAGTFLFDRSKMDFRGHGTMLGVFVLTLLPFGFWNLRHHGVFKVTPVEGGGGYMHFAYWCGKMPNYQDHISLGNFTGDELVRFTPEDSVPAHIAAFEQEWAGINARLEPLLTEKDSIMLASFDKMPYAVQQTYNSKYSLLREKLLVDLAIDHMVHDPWYTLAYKSYSAVRLWVIGIQRGDFKNASLGGKLQMLYATLSTGLVFLLALVVLPLAYKRGYLRMRTSWPLLAALVYTGVLHIPFTIQARYTVCVRFAMFALMAMAIAGLLGGTSKSGSSPTPEA